MHVSVLLRMGLGNLEYFMLMSPGAAAAPQARDRERGAEEGKRGGLGCGAVAQLEEDVLTGASGLRKTRGVADDQERVVARPQLWRLEHIEPQIHVAGRVADRGDKDHVLRERQSSQREIQVDDVLTG